ncbi:MAG TPA: hypothetical protein VH395_08115 [Jatrophihabitantaceae bacterium]
MNAIAVVRMKFSYAVTAAATLGSGGVDVVPVGVLGGALVDAVVPVDGAEPVEIVASLRVGLGCALPLVQLTKSSPALNTVAMIAVLVSRNIHPSRWG